MSGIFWRYDQRGMPVIFTMTVAEIWLCWQAGDSLILISENKQKASKQQ
jgi:hypothetical protein